MSDKIRVFSLLNMIALIIVISSRTTTSPVCITTSTTPLNNKVISENLGKTEGSDTAFSLFGIFMFSKPDFDLAIKEALRKNGGDALINVRRYEIFLWYILYSLTAVTVEGEAVKFEVSGASNVSE